MDWQAFWTALGGLVWEVLQPVLAVLLTALAVRAAQSIGLTVSAQRQAQLEHEIANVLRRGEELRANGTLPADIDLLSWATGEVERLRPKMDLGQVEDLAHSLLPTLGLGAAVKTAGGAAPR